VRYSVPSLSSLGYWKPYASSVSSIRAGGLLAFGSSYRTVCIICLDPMVESLLTPALDVNPVYPLPWRVAYSAGRVGAGRQLYSPSVTVDADCTRLNWTLQEVSTIFFIPVERVSVRATSPLTLSTIYNKLMLRSVITLCNIHANYYTVML